MRTVSNKDLETMMRAIEMLPQDINGGLRIYNSIRLAKLVVKKIRRSEKINRK